MSFGHLNLDSEAFLFHGVCANLPGHVLRLLLQQNNSSHGSAGQFLPPISSLYVQVIVITLEWIKKIYLF